ncbi:MAG: acyl-CoA dehydrogenase [Actinomycetota bacterium]|nr:acyl-CoA dehydrogenase [Actinomycetota bacterium]
MGHYRSNVRDIEFVLFEVLGRDRVLGAGPYADLDGDTARSILGEVARLATDELAESYAEADRNPPRFDPDTATAALPESFKRSFKAYLDAEWWRLGLAPELGGTPCPPTLRWALAELVLGANPAIWMYSSGLDFANVVWRLGTDEQRKIARCMVDNRWGATMVLTEPDAGSDVGAGRTRAVRQPDGSWHIEGVKRFITSGEHDLADNIVHLVLARPEGQGPGTKGLSMFVVPKFLFDWDTGDLGARNGVIASNVEKKMGLKVSTTCELRFGERVPAVGWLVGEVHDGIAQMFTVIESARMMVGTKAISTLSTGYLNALAYAKERVQGPDLTRMTDKTAPRVPITRHPDVRRSLLTQKAYAEGMRALVLYTASMQDAQEIAEPGSAERVRACRLNDLLLPLVKGYGSERSWTILGTESLQTFGGSGYLQDYPLEQYVRDAKIDTLYEGTTAIQGLDFFFRKIVRDRGEALSWLLADVGAFAQADPGGPLAEERAQLGRALSDVQAVVGTMLEAAGAARENPERLYLVGQNTTRLLMCAGELVTAWLLLREAEVALAALDRAARDRAFYEGKVAAARFFARTVLPTLAAERNIAENVDAGVMELGDDAF